MASGGKVEIQVELEGSGKVEGALNKIKKGAQLASEKAAQVGESFSRRFDTMTESLGDYASSVGTLSGKIQGSFKKIGQGVEIAGGKINQTGQALATSSNLMTSALGGVVSSVGILTEGLGGLTTASRTAGVGFSAMLGPIAIIGTALFGVVQAIKHYINTSEDLETRLEAMRAAAAEYTASLERLSEEQVVLTAAEKNRLRSITRQAKAQIEYNQKVREGEGVLGQQIERRRKEVGSIEAKIQAIREETTTDAYFLERTRSLRIKLTLANQSLAEEESKLNDLDERAMDLTRQRIALEEEYLQRGKTAREKLAQEQQKAAQDAATALQTIQSMQLRFNIEAITATGASVSERVAILRVELAERKRLIGQSIADEQERLTAIAAAEQAFSAKRRAIYKADRQQRATARAQERAAQEAAANQAFADEQKLAEARIRLTTKGIEQQKQLIELRFQGAQRAAANETQLETAQINRQRELMALEEKQQADRRAAEMQRIDALQRSIELTRQEAQALQQLSSVDMTKITSAVENFGQGLVFASLAALQSGESVSVAVGEALKAIALQAGVEAIMETARGTAKLFTPGGQAAAAGHFKAAAFFGAAAVAAGSAGSALSASGGGGTGASPTGAAQSIRDRDFDRDEERGGVTINVNMGQAVIYDTKAAAERAFADRVVQAINTPRRGAVRFRRA